MLQQFVTYGCDGTIVLSGRLSRSEFMQPPIMQREQGPSPPSGRRVCFGKGIGAAGTTRKTGTTVILNQITNKHKRSLTAHAKRGQMTKMSELIQVLGCHMIPRSIRTGAFRRGLAAAAVVTGFLAVPAESQAIFQWLSRCCGGGSATPTYGAAPLYGAAAPADPCCAPPQVSQTVNYVPQTCYRTQYVNVPVTTYRPVVGRDPCTGCPVTCMRPATTFVQQARMVPYTTYRMVLTNPCCGATPAVSAASYTAGASYAPAASCCGGAAPVTYAAPAVSAPYFGSAPAGTIVGSSTDAAANVPTLAPSGGTSGNRTYQESNRLQNLQKPIAPAKGEQPADDAPADEGTTSGAGAILSPRLIRPNDRTTSYPILRAGTHRPVSYNEPAAQPAAMPMRAVNDGGWRPSTR